MDIHHLNCGTLRPADPSFGNGIFVCHCVLLDIGDRLILIDTGIGLKDIAQPTERLQEWFVEGIRPELDRSETAIEQVRRLGYAPEQVGDIVLTHLDRDHAGGLADFPWARVHASPAARESVTPRPGDPERVQLAQWAHGVTWADAPIATQEWRGMQAWALPDLADTGLLLVELPGHSAGHAGVAIPTPEGWLLHAGDAYFDRSQLIEPSQTPRGVRAFVEATQHNPAQRRHTERVLADLLHEPDVTVFSAHDAAEFHRLSATTAAEHG